MNIPEMGAIEAEILEVLDDAQSGKLANWPAQRVSLVRFVVNSATAEQLARAFHYYLLRKLELAYAENRAIVTSAMTGYDGRPQ